MKRYTKFTVLWVVNVVLLYLAFSFFPQYYTLGSNIFSPLLAALFTGFVWNVILFYMEPVFKNMEFEVKSPAKMMFAYLGVNFVTIWFLARFAFFTGFGVSSWVYAFALAIVANFVQYVVWQLMNKKK